MLFMARASRKRYAPIRDGMVLWQARHGRGLPRSWQRVFRYEESLIHFAHKFANACIYRVSQTSLGLFQNPDDAWLHSLGSRSCRKGRKKQGWETSI
jgi:hypothetical protein